MGVQMNRMRHGERAEAKGVKAMKTLGVSTSPSCARSR